MNYSVRINARGDSKSLFECFAPEGIKKERSNYTLKKTKTGIVLSINANDATALRATVNMITQLLAVYEKMRLK
jgi:tRNA threonylcarbamoyladenosine modification (KEOPS) complex  Pcc1 subunit